jgi:uncharacterized phage protein gp47/JayE
VATYGVTAAGFVVKPLAVIKSELEADLQAAFGAEINLQPESVFGQLVGVLSERLSDAWDLAQSVYAANDPDSANGDQLDNVCAITGTKRKKAIKSTVVLTCIGTAATVLSIGRVVSVLNAGTRFTNKASATIAALAAYVVGGTYALGGLCTNGGNVYKVASITTGITGGGAGPAGTGTAITDGGVVWRFMGVGTAAVDVPMEAEQTGAAVANAGTLTQIETPVAGWASCSNAAGAVVGSAAETDPALRLRREQELLARSAGTVNSLRTSVLGVSGVRACVIFENATDVVDGNGLPPHSFEAVVQTDAAINPAVNTDLPAELLETGPAGIQSYGTSSAVVVDDSGHSQTVKWTEATQKPVYVIVNVVKDPLLISAAAEPQFKTDIAAAIVSYAAGQLSIGSFPGYSMGDDVIDSALYFPVFSVKGAAKVSSLLQGFAPAPGASADLAIATRERAVFDTSRITVNVS